MRSSILLLIAVLVAVQAAPITTETNAASVNRRPTDCWKEGKEWVCPWWLAETEAASVNRHPSDCYVSGGKVVCPGAMLAEPEAAAINRGPSECFKQGKEWVCPGRMLAEPEAVIPYSGGTSPSRLPCRTIGKETYCDGVKM
ncbi:hypothetical protein BGZ95_004650 [Linnemannia exigua]|uniref:Uncharacterized protein n=1 Tax=Linnemannia exigua TaxID=604196 RepID=A0AAD4H0P1_9FUNG|nr:hypothetical protein BGZ95_004650 [Linnemannia exigua]